MIMYISSCVRRIETWYDRAIITRLNGTPCKCWYTSDVRICMMIHGILTACRGGRGAITVASDLGRLIAHQADQALAAGALQTLATTFEIIRDHHIDVRDTLQLFDIHIGPCTRTVCTVSGSGQLIPFLIA
jgi:hypothetical protein